jgi:hypothetical protein
MKSRNNGVIVIGAAGERFNYDYINRQYGNAADARA